MTEKIRKGTLQHFIVTPKTESSRYCAYANNGFLMSAPTLSSGRKGSSEKCERYTDHAYQRQVTEVIHKRKKAGVIAKLAIQKTLRSVQSVRGRGTVLLKEEG